VLLAQVWTDYPNNFSFQKLFLGGNLIEFSIIIKTIQKFNISHTLGLKVFKSPSLSPTHGGFSTNTKSAPKIPVKILDLI